MNSQDFAMVSPDTVESPGSEMTLGSVRPCSRNVISDILDYITNWANFNLELLIYIYSPVFSYSNSQGFEMVPELPVRWITPSHLRWRTDAALTLPARGSRWPECAAQCPRIVPRRIYHGDASTASHGGQPSNPHRLPILCPIEKRAFINGSGRAFI